MSVTVRMKRYDEVELTAENEADLLDEEWERRYATRTFTEGDNVRIVRPAKVRHSDALGEDYIGKRGVVTANAEGGNDTKVLFIGKDGDFVELWTPEGALEKLAD